MRRCEECGAPARSARARFCAACAVARRRAQDRARKLELIGGGGGGLVVSDVAGATLRRLEELGAVGTPRGQAALVLASRLGEGRPEPASGLAALARQLDALLAAVEAEAPRPADVVDELRERRARRLRGV